MNMWGDKRYYSLNYFLREKFNEKVIKVSLDANFSCPNRDGKLSRKGCIYCSERGSGDFAGNRDLSITEQFESIKKMMNKKWKSDKYIAYFQAYTNTYADVSILRKKYYEALNIEGVAAIAIATRPDCLSPEVLSLLYELSKKIYVWVELGLQTINEDTALIINRGYKLPVFEEALKNLRCIGIDVVVHTIFGLPNEEKDDMLRTIKYLADNDIQGIKMHLLHLLKNTPMVKMYNEDKVKFMTFEDYVEIVCRALTYLRKDIVIHRLTGDAPRELLIGPTWSLKKWEVLNAIDDRLNSKDLYQGLYYHTNMI